MLSPSPHLPVPATANACGPRLSVVGARGDAVRAARPRSLATDRLVLEPWHPRHREAWRQLCREPAVMRYVGPGETWSAAKADWVFDAMLVHWQEHGFGPRSVLHWATRTWLGCVSLTCLDADAAGADRGAVEIGWWLVRPAWGNGYATESATAVVDDAFARLAVDRLIARVQPADRASAGVARRIGMRPDGETAGSNGELLQVYAIAAGAPPDASAPGVRCPASRRG